MDRLTENVVEELLAYGAELVGFGELSELPVEQRLAMPVGVAVAVSYPKDVIRGIGELPTPTYYEYYNLLNERLDSIVTRGAALLQSLGYDAFAQARAQVTGWEANLTTRLPHKTVATRAGLGWIGNCALLVTREFGSAVRLSSILTNAPLTTVQPTDTSNCGDCRVCTEACPGGAVSGRNWQKNLPRAAFFDADQCNKAAHIRAKRGVGIDYALCGKCIEVCPHTRRYIQS